MFIEINNITDKLHPAKNESAMFYKSSNVIFSYTVVMVVKFFCVLNVNAKNIFFLFPLEMLISSKVQFTPKNINYFLP